jgi:hypothetical protein
MMARIFKVYCYRESAKQVWFEAEDASNSRGIAWSPSLLTVINKAKKLGYTVDESLPPVIKFYRARAS